MSKTSMNRIDYSENGQFVRIQAVAQNVSKIELTKPVSFLIQCGAIRRNSPLSLSLRKPDKFSIKAPVMLILSGSESER